MELRDLDMEPPAGERAGRRFGGGSGLDSQNKQLILKAAGLLLLFILLILFFGGRGGDSDTAKELDAVKSRLDGLGNDLARVEAVEQKVASSGNRIMELQASVISLEMATRNLEMTTSRMMDQMEKPVQPVPPKPQVQPAAPQKTPTSLERRFHEVRRGETLFSIAKKYGMSAEELRNDNKLSKNFIQPGQKLVIDPGK